LRLQASRTRLDELRMLTIIPGVRTGIAPEGVREDLLYERLSFLAPMFGRNRSAHFIGKWRS
jgi:hypothetical protein